MISYACIRFIWDINFFHLRRREKKTDMKKGREIQHDVQIDKQDAMFAFYL